MRPSVREITPVYMPDECPDELQHVLALALDKLRDRRCHTIRYYSMLEPEDMPTASMWDPIDPVSLSRPPIHVMERRQWAGPAPYVGDPAIYEWEGWVDIITGQTITGSAVFVPLNIPAYHRDPRPYKRRL